MQRHESVFQTFTSLSSPADANKAPLTLKQIALIASEWERPPQSCDNKTWEPALDAPNKYLFAHSTKWNAKYCLHFSLEHVNWAIQNEAFGRWFHWQQFAQPHWQCYQCITHIYNNSKAGQWAVRLNSKKGTTTHPPSKSTDSVIRTRTLSTYEVQC